MGKNTVIRKILRREAKSDPALLGIVDVMRGNLGFVFTNGNLKDLREKIEEKKDPAPAKTGLIAPCDVFVEPGPTGLDPGQTAFFQALNIATKINRGAIEIVARVQMCFEGEKVTASAAGLLSKLKMTPFAFGITVKYVYEDGSCYDAKALDLSMDEVEMKFMRSVSQASCLSLGLGYPSMASIPHLLSNAVRKLIAFSIETDFDVELAAPFKAFLADPSAFIVATAGPDGGGKEAAGKTDTKKEEEDEDDGGFDFDDDDD